MRRSTKECDKHTGSTIDLLLYCCELRIFIVLKGLLRQLKAMSMKIVSGCDDCVREKNNLDEMWG